jgi:hypothetical protein
VFGEVLTDVRKQADTPGGHGGGGHDSVVDGGIDKPTYDGKMDKVETELNAAQAQLLETPISVEGLESLLKFAAWLLERVAGIWNSASLHAVPADSGGALGLASPGGFEPPLPP